MLERIRHGEQERKRVGGKNGREVAIEQPRLLPAGSRPSRLLGQQFLDIEDRLPNQPAAATRSGREPEATVARHRHQMDRIDPTRRHLPAKVGIGSPLLPRDHDGVGRTARSSEKRGEGPECRAWMGRWLEHRQLLHEARARAEIDRQ